MFFEIELTLAIWMVRSRMCGDVNKFCSKTRFFLEVFFSTGPRARDLEGSEAECVMTSTSFCINFSSRSRSGEVGSRMCDDVDKFCSKSMFFLDVFFEIELTLAIWRGQRQNV